MHDMAEQAEADKVNSFFHARNCDARRPNRGVCQIEQLWDMQQLDIGCLVARQ